MSDDLLTISQEQVSGLEVSVSMKKSVSIRKYVGVRKCVDFRKRGLAFSMAAMIGATGIPAAGLTPALRVYAADVDGGKLVGTASDGGDMTIAAADGTNAPAAADGTNADAGEEVRVLAGFDFKDGIGGWSYGAGWEYNYSAKDTSSVEAENEQLKFNVDYTNDKDKDWSQATVVWKPADGEKGLNLKGATTVTMDLIYDASKMTAGSFAVKLYGEGLDANADADAASAETVSGDVKKIPVKITFDALGASASEMNQFAIQLIGKNTDYKGAVWFDNIRITGEPLPDISIDSTVTAKSADTQQVKIADGKLITAKKDGSAQETALASKVDLADPKADASAKQLYAYLKAVGTSDSVIFGHQNDTYNKAGNAELSCSDTKDVTGSIAGILGVDMQDVAEKGLDTMVGITNAALADGALITMSGHMPNFANVPENPDYQKGAPVWEKYDYNGYTAPVTTNDPVNQILPGGKYNKVYTAYLDLIAEYAKQVKGAILFRPFHEGTGSWFWWGAAFCDPEISKNVYRYTVEYLRDTKDVHNLIYEYGPGSNAESLDDYAQRYPGDAYVDLVGFDMYDSSPADDGVFMGQLKKQLGLVEKFAKQHHKLVAVTETGASNENDLALLPTGNGNKDWYNQVLDIVSDSEASYFLVWADWGKDGAFYVPYVDAVNADGSLHGHEMIDHFVSFYNDSRSIFAANQKDALASGGFGKITAKAAVEGVTGYLTTPVAGRRMLKASTVKAKVTNADAKTKVLFVLKTEKGKVKLPAKADGKGYYTAKLSAKQLKSLGKGVGTVTLYINDQRVQRYSQIFNSKPPKEDPYLIDGFENYYGPDDQLTGVWTTNADSGCKVTLTLNKDKKSDGDYGLKFVYDETATGWGGATIAKEVDWSGCNALQFYMVPDGNNQKTVIQIKANGVTYEAYLNEYEAFRKNGKKPMLVTIPFTEFGERDTEGHPKGGLVTDSKQIETFGLWINAIADSQAISDGKVSGTLYYDQITAVKSKEKEASFQVLK